MSPFRGTALPARHEAAAPAQPQGTQTAQADLAVSLADVHAVGVYAGTVPPDEGRQFGGHRVGTVDVTVAVRERPVILVITAYDPVHWRIGVAPGVQLLKVFAQGYYAPLVSGVPVGTPVATRSFEIDRSWFHLAGPRSDQILEFVDQIRATTGNTVRTVQFMSRGQGFSVDGVSSLPLPGAAAPLAASTGPAARLSSGPNGSGSSRETAGPTLAADRPTAVYYGAWAAGPPPHAGVAMAPGREYRAAVTVSAPSAKAPASDAWTANFGQTPFVFPVPREFQPYGGPAPGR